MKRVIFFTSISLALGFLSACTGNDPHGCFSVEIAPGKFVPVKLSKWDPRKLTVLYSNTVVKYEGYRELNRPQTLMEFDGKLYLLALYAERGKAREKFRYITFRQEKNTFKEIPNKEFPRSIAIFNLWRPGDPGRYSMGMTSEEKLDNAQLSRELDPENKYFVNSYQSRLWYMLEVENNLYKAEREFYGDEAKTFLQEYIAKYKPVHLTSMEMKPLPKNACKF